MNASGIKCAAAGVEFMDEITAEVLRQHKLFLFQNIKKRVRGKKSNTVAKCFRFLSAFLTKNGIQMTKAKSPRPGDRGLMDWQDVPREAKKDKVDQYSLDEIRAMLAVADIDEGDLIQTFVRTGFRDEEVVYLHWSDVDFRKQQIVISEKPEVDGRSAAEQEHHAVMSEAIETGVEYHPMTDEEAQAFFAGIKRDEDGCLMTTPDESE